ncbi:MAG: hypothetical protein AABY03_02640 [Nanoarchaeota archaeon]
MSALEDSKLEKTRDAIGALAILTETSGPINHQRFVPNFIGAIETLRRKGYVEDVNWENPIDRREYNGYKLTDAGWNYAEKTFEAIGKIL